MMREVRKIGKWVSHSSFKINKFMKLKTLAGRCIVNHAIPVDTRDELQQMRFFAVGPQEHLQHNSSEEYWYYERLYYDAKRGLDCCSDTFIGTHYSDPSHFYFLEYLIYRASPFGVNKNIRVSLPRKLSLKEILDASDINSNVSDFRPHEIVHNMEDSEKFRK